MKETGLIFLIGLLLSLTAKAQELSVKSFVLDEQDLSANDFRRQDRNGQSCALLKVVMNDNIDRVEGNVIGQIVDHNGVKWVYLTEGTRMVRIIPSHHLPLMINFSDYQVKSLKGRMTYVLTLSGGKVKKQKVKELTQEPEEPYNGKYIETFTIGGVSFNMIRVSGGKFLMGATPEQKVAATDDEKPVHEVKVSTYWIGETEVTQALWEAVMGVNPVQKYKEAWDRGRKKKDRAKELIGDTYPVYCIRWDDCNQFVRRLSELTGRDFRMPTEAEWEFAARGGRKSQGTMFSGSDDPEEVAWAGSYEPKPLTFVSYEIHPVKMKKHNELGLYDMSGNVCEMCSDFYGPYCPDAQIDPKGPSTGDGHVIRGGDTFSVERARVSYRDSDYSSERGFRLAMSAE